VANFPNGLGVEMTPNVTRTSNRRDSIAPVVVDFTSKDPVMLQEMEEDLLVMSHILDQALERGIGEQAPPTVMGVQMRYTAGGRNTRGLYLDGFGALFMLKVNIPLLAPAGPKQAEAAPPNDSEWESARREVLGVENTTDMITVAGTPGDPPFDQEQLDALKRALVDALKNAGNIRHLKADDFISVAVFGQPTTQVTTVEYRLNDDYSGEKVAPPKTSSTTSSKGNKSGKHTSTSNSNNNAGTMNTNQARTAKLAAMKGTVLTLRVKKSDVSALGAGQLNADDFARRVTANSYPGSGYGMISVNSWLQIGRPTTPAPR
jgi:hypothetical protein